MINYFIQIQKDYEILANCLYRYINFPDVFIQIIGLIDNYNKNLSNADLPDEILAVRMLEEQDVEGTLKRYNNILAIDSYGELVDKYPDFERAWPGYIPDNYRKIAVTYADRWNNERVSDAIVKIDLSTKIVKVEDFIISCELTKTKAWKTLKTPEFDLEKMPFNCLYDAYDFVKNNSSWVAFSNPKVACVPRNNI